MGHPDAKIFDHQADKKMIPGPSAISFPTNGGKTIENMYELYKRHSNNLRRTKFAHENEQKHDRPGAKKWSDARCEKYGTTGMQNLYGLAVENMKSAPFRRKMCQLGG